MSDRRIRASYMDDHGDYSHEGGIWIEYVPVRDASKGDIEIFGLRLSEQRVDDNGDEIDLDLGGFALGREEAVELYRMLGEALERKG